MLLVAVFFWGSLFVSFFLLPLIAVLGLLWSPIAATISWRLARNRGLHGLGYAFAGAVYSALFLVPWLYLTMRLVGKMPPIWMIGFSYFLLYLAWSALVYVAVISVDFAYFGALSDIHDITYRILWPAMLALLLMSFLVLLKIDERLQGSQVLPGPGYILPFVGLWVSMAAFLTISHIFFSPIYAF